MRSRPLLALLALAAPFSLAGAARGQGPDPAARGLDVFVHSAPTALGGDRVALDLRAYGFATVADARPLPGASIVATWDPESLGAGVTTAPPDVGTTTGGDGQATLVVPVPDGDARKLRLLVAVRHGEHVRTRSFVVERTPRVVVALRTPDAHVVPGSALPAWITVTDAKSGGALAGLGVELSLLEGEVVHGLERVVTDASGIARASFVVPSGATGKPALSLRARAFGRTLASTALGVRDEVPATPRLSARFLELSLKPGETAHARVRVLDAADEPLAGHPVVTWTGPRGTTPPATDDEWAKVGRVAKTNGLGELTLEAVAPRVVTAHGSDVTLVVRTEVEGQKLEQKDVIAVGHPVARAELELEGGVLVPGISQRGWLHVSDGERGVAGEFTVVADGLKATVATDAHGDGELTWAVPEDVGAARQVGPCAGGVAASVVVRPTREIPALARHREPFELCVEVDRERAAVLRPSVTVARVGDKPRVTLEASKKATRGPTSVVVTGAAGAVTTAWTPGEGGEIDLAAAAPGLHTVSLATPRPAAAAAVVSARLLVAPRVLPKLAAKVTGGRLAPGGEAVVDVVLDDGHGHAITGALTAVAIDRDGGGSVAGVEALDSRFELCDAIGAPRARCDALLEGDPSAETLRRALLGRAEGATLAPASDPGAHATATLKRTFSEVLHSLEGAVYQSQTPESLRDVRRKQNGRWTWNPELMTLVTAAMKEPPTTPGGEPFALGDLMLVDPQVTFDVVARRVTRLKLFNVLVAMRSYRQGEQLDGDEPALRDPAAMLRRIVREGKLTSEALLDPWGGTIQIVPSQGPTIPFITPAKGYELRSPGPDGQIGNADDVRDPFARVVRAGTPYADAMGEDEIVDARWDMRVGDATVQAWQSMFDRLTGTTLGHGSGTGTGSGYGSGHGRLGGSSTSKSPNVRTGFGITTDTVRWTEPVRTDAAGRATLRVPLGDAETTYRIAVLGRTDAGQWATAVVEAAAFLPVSARLDLGRKLTVGDEVSARIVVRNRTNAAKSVTLDVGGEGGLALAPGAPRVLSVDVPPTSVRSVFARFVARAEGRGVASATLRTPAEADRVAQEMTIDPAGEPRVLATSARVDGVTTLAITTPAGYAPRGNARLVLESGFEDTLIAALGSIEADASTPPDALADLLEIAARVDRVAEPQGKHWLVTRARSVAATARGYLREHTGDAPRLKLAHARAALHALPDPEAPRTAARPRPTPPACPREIDLEAAPLAWFLEAEPPPNDSGPLACFTALTAKTDGKGALDLARAVHALADRPHRAPLGASLARELARLTKAEAVAEPAFEGPRGDRVIVLTALARSAAAWSKDPRAEARLTALALAMRDARGGYGSTEATRDVVRLVAGLSPAAAPSRVTVLDAGVRRVVDLGPSGSAVLPLGPRTTEVAVAVSGGPVLARLERPALRPFAGAPDQTIAPVAVSVTWPNDARAGTTGVVHVSYKVGLGRGAALLTRMPLPPGVELAAPVKGVTSRQGVLYLRPTVQVEETIALPVRFTLPGRVLVPEAETRTTSEDQPRTLTPARPLAVTP